MPGARKGTKQPSHCRSGYLEIDTGQREDPVWRERSSVQDGLTHVKLSGAFSLS